jgi:hypothetical protein
MHQKFEEITIGMTATEIMQLFDIDFQPTKSSVSSDPQERPFYDFSSHGVRVFFDANKVVRTISFFSPFQGKIRGIFIGMRKIDALKVLGKPARHWPVADGIDRFIYDRPTFFRIDIDPKTEQVSHIFL